MVTALILARILTGWLGTTSVGPGCGFFAPAKE